MNCQQVVYLPLGEWRCEENNCTEVITSSRHLPKGWSQCGISEKYKQTWLTRKQTLAVWCPMHSEDLANRVKEN